MCVTEWWACRQTLQVIIITQTLWNPVLCRKNRRPFPYSGTLWNSTPPPLLCTARGGKTNRSTCIKRSSQDWEARDFESIERNSLETWEFRTQGRVGLRHSSHFYCLKERISPLRVVSAAEFDRRIMKIPAAHRFLAVYLTLFGYLGEVYTGTVLMNSNAIKNLPGVFGSKGADTVSPSPRTSPSGSIGHKSADTLQVSPMRKRQSVRHGRMCG